MRQSRPMHGQSTRPSNTQPSASRTKGEERGLTAKTPKRQKREKEHRIQIRGALSLTEVIVCAPIRAEKLGSNSNCPFRERGPPAPKKSVRIRTALSRERDRGCELPFGSRSCWVRNSVRIRTVFSRARRSVRIRLCFRVREDVGVSQQSCSCMPSSVGNSAALRGAMRDRTPSGIAKRVERPLSQTRHVGAQRVLPPSNRSSKTLSNSSWSPTARAAAGTGTRSGSGLSALRRSLTSRYPGSRRAIFWK